MNDSSLSYVVIAIVVIAIVLYRRFAPSRAADKLRPDFIAKAAAHVEGKNLDAQTPTNQSAGSQSSDSFDDDDYNYDVVGESFQRDHLTSLIRAHDAFNTGVIYSVAVLELEPTNSFDPYAVKVVVEGTQVGYIPKFDSPAVTKMIIESGKKVYEVPARIGFDSDSPSPPIGVRLTLTVA
jgi:hypothetical protein